MATKLKAVDPKTAEPTKPKILIFGKPGVGKTWTSLDFPNCFYIDTEGGATRNHYTDKLAKSGGAYLGIEQGSLDFNVVLEQVQALATEKHTYKTLIIDSFTKLYNDYAAEMAEKVGDDYGRDKKEANKPTRKMVRWLNRLDMNVILIAHEKAKWGIDSKGNRSEIGVTFDAYEKLEYELDLCLNIVKQGPARLARVQKSRLIGFPDGDSFTWSYNDFADRYGKDVIENAAKQIVLANEDQLKELRSLLETYKLKEGQEQKWFKAADVDDYSEMNTATVTKIINYIKDQRKEAA